MSFEPQSADVHVASEPVSHQRISMHRQACGGQWTGGAEDLRGYGFAEQAGSGEGRGKRGRAEKGRGWVGLGCGAR